MAEWSNAVDSKSIVPVSGTQGSNPCLTANKQKAPVREFFVYMGGRELNPGKRGVRQGRKADESMPVRQGRMRTQRRSAA